MRARVLLLTLLVLPLYAKEPIKGPETQLTIHQLNQLSRYNKRPGVRLHSRQTMRRFAKIDRNEALRIATSIRPDEAVRQTRLRNRGRRLYWCVTMQNSSIKINAIDGTSYILQGSTS